MPPARFERTAPGLGILCSIRLSYGGTKQKNGAKDLTNKIGYAARPIPELGGVHGRKYAFCLSSTPAPDNARKASLSTTFGLGILIVAEKSPDVSTKFVG